MYQELLKRIRTKEELNKLDNEVEILENSLYEQGDKGFDSVLSSRVRHWVAAEIRNDLEKEDAGKEIYLKSLREKLTKYNYLKMTLAFEPTDISIDKFFSFVRKYISEDVVIDFDYDARILGGAQISYQGKFYDLSLRRLFDQEFEEREKDLIAEIYKSVTKV